MELLCLLLFIIVGLIFGYILGSRTKYKKALATLVIDSTNPDEPEDIYIVLNTTPPVLAREKQIIVNIRSQK